MTLTHLESGFQGHLRFPSWIAQNYTTQCTHFMNLETIVKAIVYARNTESG